MKSFVNKNTYIFLKYVLDTSLVSSFEHLIYSALPSRAAG